MIHRPVTESTIGQWVAGGIGNCDSIRDDESLPDHVRKFARLTGDYLRHCVASDRSTMAMMLLVAGLIVSKRKTVEAIQLLAPIAEECGFPLAIEPDNAPPDWRPLVLPTGPCPACGAVEYIYWEDPRDKTWAAFTCNGCGKVAASTRPIALGDGPVRVPNDVNVN